MGVEEVETTSYTAAFSFFLYFSGGRGMFAGSQVSVVLAALCFLGTHAGQKTLRPLPLGLLASAHSFPLIDGERRQLCRAVLRG